MNKIFVLSSLLLITPVVCFGSSARYTQLVRQKQQKMEQLEKCMGTSKGLQIAGISTLGLTAVGVAGNIAEAKIIKDNEKTIDKQNKTIQEKELAYNKKDGEIKKAQEKFNQEHTLSFIVDQDIETIQTMGGNVGDKAIARGYHPEQLPASLKSRFGSAMVAFITNCFALKKDGDHIANVSAGAKTISDWQSFAGNGTLKETDVLQEPLTSHEIAECKIECEDNYHVEGNTCIPDTTDVNTPTIQEEESEEEVVVVTPAPKPEQETKKEPTEEEINILKQACESPENGGHWLGKTCNCGADKVWSSLNKKCEGGEEQVTKTEPVVPAAKNKKGDPCDTTWLVKHNATKGVYDEAEGENTLSCFIQECKKGYHMTLKGKNYDIATKGLDNEVVCTKDAIAKSKDGDAAKKAPEKPKTKVDKPEKPKNTPAEQQKKTWTEAEKKANPGEYCSKHFIEGQVLQTGSPAYGCCRAIIDGRAWNYKDDQTCNCKTGTEWHNNSCETRTISENTVFAQVKTDLATGKKLAQRWGQKKGVSINPDNCVHNKQGHDIYDDWLKCGLSSGGYYEFKFDSLTASNSTKSIAYAVCELMGGHKVTESDTGLSSAIRCDVSDCSSLNSEFSVLGYPQIKASMKDVYASAAGNGTHKIWQRSYCKIDY